VLVTSGNLGPSQQSKGKRVFIWGGVRALERVCIQLCRFWGCHVTCIAPLYTHQYLRSLGVNNPIEDDIYLIKKMIKNGQRFDVVVNTAGLMAEDLCMSLSESDGRVVTTLTSMPGLIEYGLFTSILAKIINSVADLFNANLFGVERKWIETTFSGEVLDYLANVVNSGAIDPVGERILSMDQVKLAFNCLAGGGHKGKLVIRMDEERRCGCEFPSNDHEMQIY